MKIEVTAEDIANGKPRVPCAIQLAAERVLAGPIVGATRIFCENKAYRMPIEAIKFIQEFDKGAPVKPFSFEIAAEKAEI
jgi:hypothetical protein